MTKLTFLLCLCGLALGGCTKSDSTPTPAPAPAVAPSLVGTWTLTAERTVITGGNTAPYVVDRDLTGRRETEEFTAAGYVRRFLNGAPLGGQFSYTYAGGIIICGGEQFLVSELTATRLVYSQTTMGPVEKTVITSTRAR